MNERKFSFNKECQGMSRITNFRANFLEKISVSGAEFGDSLSAESTRRVLKEQILAETSDVDLSKLRKFVIKHQIPPSYHIAVWKLILGLDRRFGMRILYS